MSRVLWANIEASLFPASILFAPVKLIAVENTIDGKVLPLDYLLSVSELATEHDLKIHIDGARIFNAAVALGCPVSKIASYCDTLSNPGHSGHRIRNKPATHSGLNRPPNPVHSGQLVDKTDRPLWVI